MPRATMVSSSSLATASWWLASWPAASSLASWPAASVGRLLLRLLRGRRAFLAAACLTAFLAAWLLRRLLRLGSGATARRRRRGRHPLQRRLAPARRHGGADHRVEAPGGQRGGHVGRRPDGAEHSDDVPAGPAGHRDGHRHGHVVGLDAVGEDGPVPGDDRGGRHRLAVVADHLPSPVEAEQQAPAGVGHRVVDDDHHDGRPDAENRVITDGGARHQLGRLDPAGPEAVVSPSDRRALHPHRGVDAERRAPPEVRAASCPACQPAADAGTAPAPSGAHGQSLGPDRHRDLGRRRPSRRAAPRRRGEERRRASACPSRPGAAVARRSTTSRRRVRQGEHATSPARSVVPRRRVRRGARRVASGRPAAQRAGEAVDAAVARDRRAGPPGAATERATRVTAGSPLGTTVSLPVWREPRHRRRAVGPPRGRCAARRRSVARSASPSGRSDTVVAPPATMPSSGVPLPSTASATGGCTVVSTGSGVTGRPMTGHHRCRRGAPDDRRASRAGAPPAGARPATRPARWRTRRPARRHSSAIARRRRRRRPPNRRGRPAACRRRPRPGEPRRCCAGTAAAGAGPAGRGGCS